MSGSLILYCRGGFENDCAAEIDFHAQQHGCYGFSRASSGEGFVEYTPYQSGDAQRLYHVLDFRQLVFARHWFVATAPLLLDADDRIKGILAEVAELPVCGALRMEYPDTNDGKALSAFCKKFSAPLRKALVKQQRLDESLAGRAPALQLFWKSGTQGWIGFSEPTNSNPLPNGILRLKQPGAAPSRSTLKLDEAFSVLLNDDERERYLQPSMQAVDLGACPGGWTYQLVRRSMFVAAVDNGPMQPELMATGQVRHYRADGFKFEPEKKNVSWLVCDMVEKPSRVTALMLKWLSQGWCQYAMFNLKLPMKKRFDEVQRDLTFLREELGAINPNFEVRAKHLYHDREEVTVFARLG
jgi:23S rRNA (cytidine2498-2'-O)-methyltransferase